MHTHLRGSSLSNSVSSSAKRAAKASFLSFSGNPWLSSLDAAVGDSLLTEGE
jgi:hypothetical protein